MSKRHVLDRADGCPLAALGTDVGRATPKVRAAFSRALAQAIQTLAGEQSGSDGVIVSMSTMLGALVLTRAVSDPKLATKARLRAPWSAWPAARNGSASNHASGWTAKASDLFKVCG